MAFDPQAVRAFEHARWQDAAPRYGATFAGATRPFISPLLDAAAVGPGKRLLDIACGPGFVASAATARGAMARGVDFSSAMLAAARAREPSIPFDEGDAESLPCDDGSCDAVISNFGIHHLPCPSRALREAYRTLRVGGRVAFSFWAEPADNIAWKLVFDAVARNGDRNAARTPAPGGGLNSAAQCADALREAGFIDTATHLAHAIWRHVDAAALVAALRAGTARMAAMLEAQRPEALRAIIEDIATNTEPYHTTEGLAVPIAAVIASGAKG